jgi:hypothetical protein
MARALRIDRGTLGDLEETPQGGLAIPAFVTRVGVFEYEQPDGKVIREYRPPEEVFHKDALATLPNATLTNEHPDGHVHPGNFKKHVVGHVEKDVKQDGDKIAARLIVQDKKTLDDIKKRRRREVSCGYHCDVDEAPGVTSEGERYDRVQRNIRYNHVALVDAGRAGPDVRLRLDSSGNASTEGSMKVEIIDGVEYEIGTPAHAKAVQLRADSAKQRDDAFTKLKADHDRQEARAVAAESKLKKLEDRLTVATSAARLDARVQKRARIIARARAVLGSSFKADGLSSMAIAVAAVKKHYPDVRLDGKSKEFIAGLFRAIKLDARRADAYSRIPPHLRRAPEGFEPQRARRADDGSNPARGKTLSQLRADRDGAEPHRRPLAVSKDNPHKEIDGFPAVQGSMLENMR